MCVDDWIDEPNVHIGKPLYKSDNVLVTVIESYLLHESKYMLELSYMDTCSFVRIAAHASHLHCSVRELIVDDYLWWRQPLLEFLNS